MAFGGQTTENTYISISGVRLEGATSFSTSFSRPTTKQKILGGRLGVTIANGPPTASVRVNRNYLFTGDLYSVMDMASGVGRPISGNIMYDGGNFRFNSGYISEFSISCGVGEIPTVTNNIEIFGAYDGTTGAVGAAGSSPFLFSTSGINLIVNGAEISNSVTSFSLSRRANFKPIYSLTHGSAYPKEVKYLNPVEVSASFELDLDTFTVEDYKALFTTGVGEGASAETMYDVEIGLIDISGNTGFYAAGEKASDATRYGEYAVLEQQGVSWDATDTSKINLTYNWYEWNTV